MKPKTSVKIGIALSIVVAFLFLASGMAAPMSSGMQANNYTAAKGIQPYETLNSNITWSIFHSSWKNPLTYNNGTANLTLNTEPSTYNKNYISVNASKIQSNALQTKLLNSSLWDKSELLTGNGVISSLTQTGKYITISTNASASTTGQSEAGIPITWTQLPSQNFAYDYITMTGYESGSKAVGWNIAIYNQTTGDEDSSAYQTPLAINETAHNTQIQIWNAEGTLGTSAFFASFPLSIAKNISVTKSTGIQIAMQTGTPKETTTQNAVTITGLAITEYQMSLGQTATGSTVYASLGNSHLASYSPTMKGNVTNNGYTVAVSQPLQKASIQQNAISGSNYIEQVEYQGSFGLPSAPDLSYGPTSLTEQLNISSSQVQVLDINGQSYLSSISGKNGTITLITAANPTQTTTFLQIVDYTQAQWNSISSAPGLFTIMGIEYYWWIAVGGLATLLGLAAAAKHAGTKADQERIPKKGGR